MQNIKLKANIIPHVIAIILMCLNAPSALADGVTLSLGKISPVDFGVGDEGHLQLGNRIGYRFGRLQPQLVLDYARLSVSEDYTYDDYDYDLNKDISVHKQNEATTGLLTIGAGLKYFLTETKAKTVQTSISGSLFTFIPLLSVNGEADEDLFKDSSAFGFNLAFGAQYAFHERFSLGMELGAAYSSVNLNQSSSSYSASLFHIYHSMFLEFVL